MTDEAAGGSAARACQWCGAVATPGTTHCAACGAALPLAGPVDELRIPGVTDVDPELKLYAKDPLRLPKGSPTQGLAGGAMGAAAIGGPGAILALGALAAVAANEYRNAGQAPRQHHSALEVGQPSEAALEMARRLREAEAGAATQANPQTADPAVPIDRSPDAAATIGGRLPPPPPPPPLSGDDGRG